MQQRKTKIDSHQGKDINMFELIAFTSFTQV